MAKSSTVRVATRGLLLVKLGFGIPRPKPSSSPTLIGRHRVSPIFSSVNRSVSVHLQQHINNRFSSLTHLLSSPRPQLCSRRLLLKSAFSNGDRLSPPNPAFSPKKSSLSSSPSSFISPYPKHNSSSQLKPLFAYSSKTLFGFGGELSTRVRRLSFRTPDIGKINAKTVLDRPISVVRSAFSRYREAIGLQIEAFWRRNYLVLLGAGGVLICALLWRVMFGIANTFVGISEGMAKMAMRRLNTSAGILEVMGAPLSGTDLRAYVMSGGGLMLKNFRPSLRSKRCFLIFPIQGSERKGLVSVEVKKKKGQYDMKLLAVDILVAAGQVQRLFLIGDEEEYKVGGGLISELREPVARAMAAEKEFEDLDQIEDEEDAERELQEAERKHREEMERLEKDG
ncbi:uncharacterized protein LOC131167887 isoform X2 [Malania oleifera]|uniref:uncharacterized protein LOC131167887 isoform X2 n=1 Tax=Malania oleifera TaxID=397392 RepID=UPI0025AE37AB|nr:uncharacterized protein LOC131167887 isoform X2 [Malania oleifera]